MPRPKSIWTSSGTLLFLIAVGGLLTLCLVLASAVWASRQSDTAALNRQRGLVDSRLRTQIESVASELSLMADGFANTITGVSSSGELQAFDGEKFSRIITSVSRYDQAFVVWSNGNMAIQGGQDSATVYRWIRPLVTPMLKRAVQNIGKVNGSAGTVELMRLQGRPSIAGIVPINTPVHSRDGQSLYLMAYRYIDGAALDALSREQGLNSARFARSSDPGPDEVTFQIEATTTKEPIGFIIWEPDLPGSRVIASMIPGLAGAAAIVACLLALLIMRLRKSLADLQESEQKSRHRSLHDILTDLPNRALFDQQLGDRLARYKPAAADLSVALIDLDRFKSVNDTLGHAAGDSLIQMAAGRISKVLGPSDVLARLGGDEFALLLPADARRDGAGHLQLCSRIVEELSRPFTLLGGKAIVHIGCSIGITRVEVAGKTPSEVLHQADVALYEAKFLGRGRCVQFLPSMDAKAKLRESLKSDLRAVLDTFTSQYLSSSVRPTPLPEMQLKVFYQTIHDATKACTVSGAEALVRWQHPKHGLLTPDLFVPLAEDSGLIEKLGHFVLQEACQAATLWPSGSFVSVNVSPAQLRSTGFADLVLHVLDRTGLAPTRLELELTETALMGPDDDLIRSTLQRLRNQGIKIALDDFGTGYSSLSHLIHFPVDRLKIDRSFVRLLGTRADGAVIVSAIVDLSQNLNLATTAEGVETTGQRDLLISLGCAALQGFLFSQPQPNPDMSTTRRDKHLARA